MELKNQGFEVKVSSLCSDFQGIVSGIEIESYSILDQSSTHKINAFLKICKGFVPDCIVASEPLAVIAAGKYRKKLKISIIYDITEWYPSFRMLQEFSGFSKKIHKLKFFLIQLYAGFISTHFIFGEESKKFPLATFFPFKKILMLPYYPDEKYIHQNIKKPEPNKIKLCYTGRLSKEDGIGNFFSAIGVLRHLRPDLDISILIIGAPKKETDKIYFSMLLDFYKFENLILEKPVKFENFTKAYSDADICFDLRENNAEYNLSLPIKLFYYIASGKPIIYTNLESIEKHIDITKFGCLVNPKDSELIANLIAKYSDDVKYYNQQAHNASATFEEKYNWKLIKNSFVNFVKSSTN